MRLTGKELWRAYNGFLVGHNHTPYTWPYFKKLYPMCSAARKELEEKLFQKEETMNTLDCNLTKTQICARAISLGSCPTKAAQPHSHEVGCYIKGCNIPSAKEDNMSTIQITEDTRSSQDARRYLESRLYNVMGVKRRDAEQKFNITDMDAPKTPKEFADRIAKGLFVVRDLDKNPEKNISYYEFSEILRWRDPSKPADKDAMKAFQTKLDAEETKVTDTIRLLTAEAALAALQAFETKDLLAN